MSTDATAGMAPPDNQQQPQPPSQSPATSAMPTEPTTTVDPNDIAVKGDKDQGNVSQKPIGLHSPPDSNNAMKLDTSDDSDLSDLEDPAPELSEPHGTIPPVDSPEEDIGDVLPDHWSGTVPVFKPTMHQFKDFKKFVCRRPCCIRLGFPVAFLLLTCFGYD